MNGCVSLPSPSIEKHSWERGTVAVISGLLHLRLSFARAIINVRFERDSQVKAVLNEEVT